jgi:lysozyme family protein
VTPAFEQAWAFLQRDDIEGGAKVSRDPDDPGGTTKWGISQRAFPAVDIGNLTEAHAKQLFLSHYWTPIRGDEWPPMVAVALADSAFNQGVKTAITLLQEAVKANPDGLIGPATLAEVRRRAPDVVVNEFLSRRALRYADGKAKYRRGWFLRLFKLRQFLSAG